MERIKRIVKKMISIICKPEMKILPGNVAFFLVLSIVPIVILIGVICSMMSISTDTLSNFMNSYFPEQISDILVPYFSGQGVNLNVIIFTIMGFFIASNGAHAIIIASNRLYGVEDSSFLKKRLKAFNMIILLIFTIIFMLLFLAFGSKIMNFLTNRVLGDFASVVYYAYLIIKWPIGLLFIFIIVKLLYTLAPDKKIKSKYVNRGALFTTIGWVITTFIYGYYATNIANYSLFYGSLSSIVVMMFWFYLIAYILVIGIVINITSYEMSTLAKESEKDGVRSKILLRK